MSKLKQAKTRLQDAIIRLETAIQKKFLKLEVENNTLKAQLTKPKGEAKGKQEAEVAPAVTTKRKSKDEKTLDLINAKTSNEIDISLNELKKLVK